MKSIVNKKLAEVIREWASTHKTKCQPNLSYEVDDINKGDAIKLLLESLGAWETDCFIFTTLILGELNVEIVNRSNLENVLNELYEREMTASVIDPSKIGGCTIDFDDIDDGLCLMVASWGEHENMSIQLNEKYQGGTLFRGN